MSNRVSSLASTLIKDTGEKLYRCILCGMAFVRKDLMLRHGRLKPEEVLALAPDGLHTLASVLPDDRVDPTTMDIEAYYTSPHYIRRGRHQNYHRHVSHHF